MLAQVQVVQGQEALKPTRRMDQHPALPHRRVQVTETQPHPGRQIRLRQHNPMVTRTTPIVRQVEHPAKVRLIPVPPLPRAHPTEDFSWKIRPEQLVVLRSASSGQHPDNARYSAS